MPKRYSRTRKCWRKKVWIGFRDGRPAYTMIDTGFGGWGHGGYWTIIIFTDKKRARREYEDVRLMELVAMPRRSQGGRMG